MPSLCRSARAALVALAAPAIVAGQGAVPRAGAQVTARVTPEAPAIGEPITIELRVRAPAGSTVEFPALPDSSDAVEPLDPRAVREASTAEWLDRTAVYRMIAWDTGSRVLRFDDVRVTAEGATQAYRVTLPSLRVRSVLPADSTGRVPRPPRALVEPPSNLWRLWLALAVLLALALWSWRAWRRRAAAPDAGPDAGRLADEGFRHAAALGLLEAGEHGRYALMHVAVMREYLARRFPEAAPSRTARELADALTGVDFPILPERVAELLLAAEPVAFAGAPLDAEGARGIAREAQAIVRDVETAWLARRASVAKQRRRR